MSDPETGELLFYGSMVGLFNKQHQSMPNGLPHAVVPNTFGGGVGNSAEEGTLIIPRPNHPKQYYIIYLRSANTLYQDGLIAGSFATLVDMELDGGLGDVVTSYKNVLIADSTEEKLSATPHANGIDYWLMVRQGFTNSYHAFLITENGVSSNPVTSSIGVPSFNYDSQQGNLRFNHRGDVFVHSRGDILEIFDFDNASGLLSNYRLINPLGGSGLEFSPDDSKLYTGGPIQYDLSDPSQAAIQASETMLFTLGDPPLAGLQLGLDGKIYGNNFDGNQAYYMGCIHNPNAAGVAANYEDSVIYLQGRRGLISVPNFMPSIFQTNFYADTVCVGEEALFYMNYTFIDSVFWDFGDPNSGAANTDTAIAPSHVYSSPGSYTVTLIAQNGVRTDTVIKTIEVLAPPTITLGADQEFCGATDSVKLGLGGLKGVYQWSTGSADSTQWVTETGNYALTFTNTCGSDADTITLTASEPLQLSLPPDTSLCGDAYTVLPEVIGQNAYTQYRWMDGTSAIGTVVERTGAAEHTQIAWLVVSNACGTDSAAMQVTFYAQPDGTLPNDSIYCLDRPFYLLNPQTTGITYAWSNGEGGPQLRISESGTYWLLSASVCDTLIDTFTVIFNGQPRIEVGGDTFLCPGEEVVLTNRSDSIPTGQSYVWAYPGTTSNDSLLRVVLDEAVTEAAAFTQVNVRATLRACSTTDSIKLYRKGFCPERCVPEIPNVITPNGDGLNDVLRVRMTCNTQDLQLFIYNRWGQLVHRSEGYTTQWDGSIAGSPASDGTYYYVLEFTDERGEGKSYRGTLNVLTE